MFRFVTEVPAVGVHVVYSSSTTRDHYLVIKDTSDKLPIQGRITTRTHYNASSISAMQVVMRHEVGHALGFQHSIDPQHLMIGGQASVATRPTLDEVWLVNAMYNISRGTSLAWYRFD